MEFNSWRFVVFLVAVVAVYGLVRSRQQKNIVLLVSSYLFYSAWDWRFCSLIILSTVSDFLIARRIYFSESSASRRRWLALSICINLGVLGFFKYFNFFANNVVGFFAALGLNVDVVYLNIILPIGISFYTFQTMSYTIDVYRGKLKPTDSFVNFAVFVSFFPQLIAGPIERAKNILPQLAAEHGLTVRQVLIGTQLICWGLFKKVYVADNVAFIVDELFGNSAELSFGLAYLAVLGFAVQIYADFSAYSDIARGCAKIFGIDLMQNFRNPYIATSPQDFWRRWHISLSTWLRDYLYIPLGGNRGRKYVAYRNLLVTMILGGLWHGAAWNFVFWGIYHGSILGIHRFLSAHIKLSIPKWISVFTMFQFTLFGWLLFRCTRVVFVDGVPEDQSFTQIGEFFGAWSRGIGFDSSFLDMAGRLLFFSVPLFAFEALNFRNRLWFPLQFGSRLLSVSVVALMLFLVVRYGVQDASSFIYFQF
ncbi:MAG: MBOAT family protein [Gammaproteobacteria bacterium]|nr:MBOAT family protein [Gammaproteobacteria bacterium]